MDGNEIDKNHSHISSYIVRVDIRETSTKAFNIVRLIVRPV